MIRQGLCLSGTEAERAAYETTGLPVLTTWSVTSGPGRGAEYSWGGTAWIQTCSAGAAHVLEVNALPPGTQTTREVAGLDSTAVTLTFDNPIKAVRLSAVSDTAHNAEMAASVAFCIDPPNSTVRDAWLTGGSSLTTPSNRLFLKVGGEAILTFRNSFGAPVGISAIGLVLADGGGTLRVDAVGVEL